MRSLWSARDFLKRGLKWSIGTGETISVWNQPWLKDPICLQPITEVQTMCDALTVGHLFKPNAKEWNENFIRYVFIVETANQILQTPHLQLVHTDKATWRLEKNGLYSVRSAYREIINSNDAMLHYRVPGNWNKIWNLKLPPKIKNFMWRICRNCLPTRMRLLTKGVKCSPTCAICDNYEEDGKHLFFECSKSVGCWQRLGFWSSIQHVWSSTISCAELIFSLVQQLDITQQQIFSVTLWSIWKHRNNKVWKNIVETNQHIGDRAVAFLNSWKNAQETIIRSLPVNSHSDISRWSKPSVGRFKCNVDAYFFVSLNKVGFGACIRDAEGNYVIGRTDCLTPLLDVEMGEAIGLLYAMHWVKDLNLVNMDFETDSKVVAESIYKGEGVSDFMAIIHKCRHLLMTDLANSDVRFIRRQANSVAHSLARETLNYASFQYHLNIPHCIHTLINNEKL